MAGLCDFCGIWHSGSCYHPARYEYERLKKENALLRDEVSAHRAMANGDYWCWQGDGDDHLESLTCRVLIQASDLRKLTKGSAG